VGFLAGLRPGGWWVCEEPTAPTHRVPVDPDYPGADAFEAFYAVTACSSPAVTLASRFTAPGTCSQGEPACANVAWKTVLSRFAPKRRAFQSETEQFKA
jgi:hypothetical protein